MAFQPMPFGVPPANAFMPSLPPLGSGPPRQNLGGMPQMPQPQMPSAPLIQGPPSAGQQMLAPLFTQGVAMNLAYNMPTPHGANGMTNPFNVMSQMISQMPTPGGSSSGTKKPSSTTTTQASASGSTGSASSGTDYRQMAADAANQYGVPTDLFTAQINQESGFNPTAASPAGAQGIAQFMPGTAQGLGIDPTDPKQSLYGAAKLMKSYYDTYGSWADALIAYNGGTGTLQNWLNGGDLPQETIRYLNDILGPDWASQ